jgi:hypothetical protein
MEQPVSDPVKCQKHEKESTKQVHAGHYSTESGSNMNKAIKIISLSPPKNKPGNSD